MDNCSEYVYIQRDDLHSSVAKTLPAGQQSIEEAVPRLSHLKVIFSYIEIVQFLPAHSRITSKEIGSHA